MISEAVVPTNGVEKQPFIPYVGEKDYPESLKLVLQAYVQRMGFLPNALKLYMHRPEIAETLWKLNSNVMRDASSTLNIGLKRRLATLASKVNECAYCTTHHCTLLKSPGGLSAEGWEMGHEELLQLVNGMAEPADEMERVCFDFVQASSLDPHKVPEDVYERLKALLTPPQIIELACLVGFWKMYNTIHDALRIPIESQLLENVEYAKS